MVNIREEIVKLRNDGLSKVDISKKLGIHPCNVTYHLDPEFRFRQRQRRKNYISLLKEERGNKCEKCGYNKCKAALHFHHLDKTTKLFGLSNKGNKGKAIMKTEADKCILLCANCHAETEWPDPYMEGIF